MVQRKDRKALFTAGAIFIVLLVVIGAVALLRGLGSDHDAAEQTPTTSQTDQEPAAPSETDDNKPSDTPSTDSETSDAPQLDPETVATVDIQPMEITVSYVKGVGGFEYLVQRTASGTQYVEFKSPQLVGTKCTGDAGAFASILESPSSNESSTIAEKTTVEGVEYGLSLAASNCTSNVELLQQYQDSFSDAFSLLKKIQ